MAPAKRPRSRWDVGLPPWTALARLRTELGENRCSLGRKVGLSPNYLRNLEMGQRKGSPDTLRRIAKHFGWSVDQLEATRDLGPEDPLPALRRWTDSTPARRHRRTP